MLRLTVGDDGRGGADPAAAPASTASPRRLAAFDGTLTVSSPPGGPTVVTMECPCATVVIAEDLALLRDGLTRLLRRHGFEVVEAVDNGPRAGPALIRHRPDVAVVDVRLPPTFTDEGSVAARGAQARPGLPVLVLTQYVEPLYARELLSDASGAVGYLLKDRIADVDEFVDAVRQVAAAAPRWTPR